ncbi:hypothetical protein KCH_36340 [Kitasatospora cheerisanensis KCTC 2395]|uniref:Uncharacterized protein n=1 Tax=Kitasatospora cheerisanensis KCTC 2395 TaxID=1348663 RepID=A0A066YTG6_9ACTN|nr:hypothetical protein KCH_36340 [Kitasatospora cheerisanensis KCTC 2395]
MAGAGSPLPAQSGADPAGAPSDDLWNAEPVTRAAWRPLGRLVGPVRLRDVLLRAAAATAASARLGFSIGHPGHTGGIPWGRPE